MVPYISSSTTCHPEPWRSCCWKGMSFGMSPGSELSRQEKLDQILEGITDVHRNFDDLLITLSASMQEHDRNNAPINVNPWGGGGQLIFLDIIQCVVVPFTVYLTKKTKGQSKVSKKPPPQGRKSKQTIL